MMERTKEVTINSNRSYRRCIFFFILSITLAACSAQSATDYPEDPTGFFPALSDPPDAYRPGGGGGGNSESRGRSFDLITDLPIEEVLQHYAQQLEVEGWTSISENIENGLSISYWERQTDTGQVWPAILEISPKPADSQANYSVELRAILPP